MKLITLFKLSLLKFIFVRKRISKKRVIPKLLEFDRIVVGNDDVRRCYSFYNKISYFLLWVFKGLTPSEYFYWGGFNTPFLVKWNALNNSHLFLAKHFVNNSDDVEILNDKILFNSKFYDLLGRKFWCFGKDVNLFVSGLDRVIVKPSSSYGGRGIFFVSFDGMLNNDEKVEFLKKKKLLNSNFILEECIAQEGFYRSFNPATLNILRVITFFHNNTISLLDIWLCTGKGGDLIANPLSGGIQWSVDLQSMCVQFGTDCKGSFFIKHPNTKIIMRGLKLIKIQEVLDLCAVAHKRIPNVPLVGWDVAVSNENLYIIEGNACPGFANVGSKPWYKIEKEILKDKIEIPKTKYY